eukprot:9288-Heterococcus_DN1.PRE.4
MSSQRGSAPLKQLLDVPADVFREGVRQHAALLGMHLPEDSRYLWIAEEFMLADLPEGWVTVCDDSSNGIPYFWHAENQESTWEHPRDEVYRQLYKKRKADDQQLVNAVKANDAKQLQLLLDSGGSTAVADETGNTLLQVASRRATAVECVQVLLVNGADIEATDTVYRTALHTAADCSSTAAITMLLTKGAAVNATDSQKQTPLHLSRSSQVVTLLLDNGADIEACDSNGETPLHYAGRNSRAAIVDALVVAGAKVGAANIRGDTPLLVTALHTSDSNTEAINALVVAGAQLGSRNNEGKTAYDIACAAQRDVDVLNLLRPAAASSSVAHVIIASNTDSDEVIVDHVVAVESTSATVPLVESCAAAANTGTAIACNTMSKREAAKAAQSRQQLLSAVEANNAEKLQSLLDSGASTAITDDDGYTLLQSECRCDAVDCVAVILASGADIEGTDTAGRTALHKHQRASVHATDNVEQTPLSYAATGEIVALQLDTGADIEARDVDGDTTLHSACAMSRTSAIIELVRRGAVVSALNDEQQTSLHRAFDSTDSEIITVLLNSGAGIETRDSLGKTPLHCAAHGSTVAVTALLQRGAAVGALNNDQHTPLHYAVNSGTIGELMNAGANIEARDCDGDTPLHCACAGDRSTVTAVTAFIEAEAELNTIYYRGDTPLHAAVSCNTVTGAEVVELLVAAGARTDVRNKAGKTAYDIAYALGLYTKLLSMIQPDATESREQLLHAVHSANATELQTLLNFGIATATTDIDASGADANTCDKHGATALHAAAACNVIAAVKLLLANGASAHATDCDKRTPLHEANSSEVVALLLDSGADIEARAVDGATPLHDAAYMSSPVTLKALLQRELLRYGADIEARDINGETPLHHAGRYNRETSAHALIAAGAQVDTTNNAGDTPLHATAFYTGSESTTEVITALVAAGARLDITNNEGKTAYEMAWAAERDGDVLNLLRPAAASSSAARVEIENANAAESKAAVPNDEPTAATAATAVAITSS